MRFSVYFDVCQECLLSSPDTPLPHSMGVRLIHDYSKLKYA